MSVIIKNLGSGIKKIIINDPKTYNSLSILTLNLLIKTFKKLDRDNSTKVIILNTPCVLGWWGPKLKTKTLIK